MDKRQPKFGTDFDDLFEKMALAEEVIRKSNKQMIETLNLIADFEEQIGNHTEAFAKLAKGARGKADRLDN